MSKPSAAYAALSLAIDAASNELQILPAGNFAARDGRPQGLPHWRLNAQIANRLIEKLSARKNPLVIDYEHRTMRVKETGEKNPAAGWMGNKFEWREGSGLWATEVDWTEEAAADIKAKRYRFYSPVFAYNKNTGEIVDLLHGGLTNDPAIDGMHELAARAAAHFSITTENDMDLINKLLAALGLKPVETEEAAIAAATAMKAAVDKDVAELSNLRASDKEKDTRIATLSAAKPDPAKYVDVATMTSLQAQVAELTKKIRGGDVDKIVVEALSNGRLLPAQEEWARKLGDNDIESLTAYIDKAVPIAALSGTQTDGGRKKPDIDKNAPLTEVQQAACKNLGVTEEAFKATLIAEAA